MSETFPTNIDPESSPEEPILSRHGSLKSINDNRYEYLLIIFTTANLLNYFGKQKYIFLKIFKFLN
jgi:hypothetical protein